MRLPNADDFPAGDLRGIYLHWTGAGYTDVFASYHFCIAARDGRIESVATHDLRANMRDVRAGGPYAAHTFGRNSFTIGIALCAMHGATPHDFGAAPLGEAQLDAACALAARLCRAYRIPIAAVRTHAEAALEDGYFGSEDEQRWDIARFRPASAALAPWEAGAAGDALRARVAREANRAR